MLLFGIDFTSRPSKNKAITVAQGKLAANQIQLQTILHLHDFDAFETLLAQPGPWLAACDFPFGFPRELVEALQWPHQWDALMQHIAQQSRHELVTQFKAFCANRPAGQKFAHRATDLVARSSPSMKWVNPPVAFMLKKGAPRLLAAGVHISGLHEGDRYRVALEGYPALLARSMIGSASYKSDDKAKQTLMRQMRRAQIVQALTTGKHPLGLQLVIDDTELMQSLINDGSADRLDAVLCLLQAGWATTQSNYGLPGKIDSLEGWIVTAAPEQRHDLGAPT
ncbi:DUF429 domain-containing protein [Chitinimonas sp. BJB300]|uniref:DUF429 domain-containing protein n=1 Tax=Chitinimonas sp. BJB300 TaxID=1559339 RepID=UPI000C0F7853|nr:DUF429 domain-containing protein [Chitinimonas sp. BJB300]PHV10511.1 DUF429 domain-containing protein [Chitinimonas sp. BJB300]TSJ90758.1 DUF429 domain-containing protein [Chitinimonas sp. BJB300]